jgi:hypothetical protein
VGENIKMSILKTNIHELLLVAGKEVARKCWELQVYIRLLSMECRIKLSCSICLCLVTRLEARITT